MYSFPNLETVHCSISSSNCCIFTCTQVLQEAGQVVWYSHLFKNSPVCCDPHSQSIVNEAEVDVFWNFLAFSLIQWMLAIWSLVSLPFLDPAWTSGGSQFMLKPSLENFEHYFASMWNECNLCGSLNILCYCLSLGLEWKLTFSSPVATAEFSKFAGILSAAL